MVRGSSSLVSRYFTNVTCTYTSVSVGDCTISMSYIRKCAAENNISLKYRGSLSLHGFALSPRKWIGESTSRFSLGRLRIPTSGFQTHCNSIVRARVRPANCSVPRLIIALARNCDVIHELFRGNFRNAGDYSTGTLPYAFRVTERCERFVQDASPSTCITLEEAPVTGTR